MRNERRAHGRVGIGAPVVAGLLGERSRRSGDASIAGTLVNASTTGVAFASSATMHSGDLLELVVMAHDGSTVLQKHARVLGCVEDSVHRRIVRCAFVEPLHDLAWVDRAVAVAPGDPAPA